MTMANQVLTVGVSKYSAKKLVSGVLATVAIPQTAAPSALRSSFIRAPIALTKLLPTIAGMLQHLTPSKFLLIIINFTASNSAIFNLGQSLLIKLGVLAMI